MYYSIFKITKSGEKSLLHTCHGRKALVAVLDYLIATNGDEFDYSVKISFTEPKDADGK